MPSNKRTIYLGLDYSQFTGGVTEVNRKMGLLDAEFKLAKEQAKNYGTETDELGLKQDYLSQKIALQAQKVEEAKKAYDAAMSSQSASQKEIDALDKKLLQERTTLEKLNGELKTTDKEIQETDKDTKTFGDQIRGLAGILGVNVNPAVEKLAKKFDGISAGVGTAIMAVAAIGTAFVKCAKETAAFADELMELSSTTGIATDELQKMQYAADFIDVSVETMTGSMTKLTKTMSNARDGSKDASEAFRKLGIRVTDSSGQLRDSNEVFYEAIDKLGRIKNETERDAEAMKLFGKSAKELNPLIEAGSQRLKELGDEAENLGMVMSEEELEKAGKLQDALDRMSKAGEKLKQSLGMVLIPVLTTLFDVISKIPVPVLSTLVILGSVVTTVLLAAAALKKLSGLAGSITGFFNTFNLAANKTTLIIIGVIAAVIVLISLITTLAGKSKDAEDAVGKAADSVTQITNSVTGAQNNYKKTANNATGTADFAGGKTWVGEAGPELVELPEGSRITPADQVGQTVINNYYCEINARDVKEFNDVVRIMNNQRMAERRYAY